MQGCRKVDCGPPRPVPGSAPNQKPNKERSFDERAPPPANPLVGREGTIVDPDDRQERPEETGRPDPVAKRNADHVPPPEQVQDGQGGGRESRLYQPGAHGPEARAPQLVEKVRREEDVDGRDDVAEDGEKHQGRLLLGIVGSDGARRSTSITVSV